MAQVKKCIVILLGIAFVASLATSCCKTCECKDTNGEVLITSTECGCAPKSCKEVCKQHNLEVSKK